MADAEGGLRVAQMASAPPYSQAQYAKAPAADLNTNDSGINETEAHAEQGGASPKSSDPSSPSQPPYASPVPLANSPAPNDAQSGVLGLSHGSHASLQGLEPLSPQLQESLDEYMALAVPGTPAPLAPPEPQEDPLRTEGLGLFHVLPDKIILRLLEWLTMESNPAHLYRLMLVSHAFHQFASWGGLWRKIAENLSGGDFTYEHSWRFTTQKIYAESQRQKREKESGVIEADPPPLTPIDYAVLTGFYSEKMYRKWYRANANLYEYVVDSGLIARIPRLSPEEFKLRFDTPRTPVIMPDIVPKWRAYGEWHPDRLVARFPDVIVKIAQASQTKRRLTMTMEQRYARLNRDDQPLYVFDSSFERRMPELLDEYEIPKHFWMDLFSLLGKRRPMFRWLVMGPARSGSGFHIDPNGTSAWNALLHGRKRWAFYPPDVPPPGVGILHTPDGEIADFKAPDPLKWYYEVYPTLPPHLRPIEIVQNAGDMLFVPAGWWHMVLNLEETISVTQNFVNEQNLMLVVKFLYRQGDLGMLHVWMDALKEVRPDLLVQVEKKLKVLDGKQARMELEMRKEEFKEKSKLARNEKRALQKQVRELTRRLGVAVNEEEDEKEEGDDTNSESDSGRGDSSDSSDEESSSSGDDVPY